MHSRPPSADVLNVPFVRDSSAARTSIIIIAAVSLSLWTDRDAHRFSQRSCSPLLLRSPLLSFKVSTNRKSVDALGTTRRLLR